MQTPIYFNKNLRYLRRINAISAQDLSKKMGVSRSTISAWETSTAYPLFDALIRLSDIFQVDLESLVKKDLQAETILDEPISEVAEPYATPRGGMKSSFSSGEVTALKAMLDEYERKLKEEIRQLREENLELDERLGGLEERIRRLSK